MSQARFHYRPAISVAILTRMLADKPGWIWLSELSGVGIAERGAVISGFRPGKVTLNIDGEVQVIRPRTVFRGTLPESEVPFILVAQGGGANANNHWPGSLDSIGLVYREADEAAVINLVSRLLQKFQPLQELRCACQPGPAHRALADVRPVLERHHPSRAGAYRVRLHRFVNPQPRNAESGGLDHKARPAPFRTARRRKINGHRVLRYDIAGEASIIIVEAVEHIRSIYHLAQTLAPAVVILEDLDLMTKSRQNPYAYSAYGKDDVTGELLQVLSGGSAYADIVTIATTNHPEAIDEALAKRAGRFDAHIRMGYPGDVEKQRILNLYLDRFGVNDDVTRGRLQQTLKHDLGRLHLVPAHIEELVEAGIKRARLAGRAPEYRDFEPGVEATKSIATQKPSA